jgi:phage-related protein
MGLGRGLGNIIAKVAEIGGSIIGAIGGFVGDMLKAGGNLIQGLVNGISNAKNAVVNKVKEIASGALDAIKNFFGIHSPSRVMAKMGNYMMEGLNKGIIKTGQTVIGSTQAVANSIAATFGALDGQSMSATINGNVSDVSGVSSALGGNYLNETSNNSHIENHIGTIAIADQVDAENWLKKLTREDEITRTGLTSNV